MNNQVEHKLLSILNDEIDPLPLNNQFNSLLEKIGESRFVLIGEATHGTKEFYQMRIDITRTLIQEKNFMAVAIEGDWPDTYQVHRYICGFGAEQNTSHALSAFKRFPVWMWRNQTLPPFIHWLRSFNDARTGDQQQKLGFYGLDLYSLYRSIDEVINYLSKVDAQAAKRASERYACFDHKNKNPQSYGYLTTLGVKKPCVKEAVAELIELQNSALQYLQQENTDAAEEYFNIIQNARVVKNAENYYRVMFEDHISSWNVRDRHMAETLDVLADHLESIWRKPAKIIVWAHNSHVGDARATEMAESGEVNIGQLVREKYGSHAYLIGFSTYQGTVTAASNWGDEPERKLVKPGLKSSYEELFHELNHPNFLLHLRANPQLEHYLGLNRLQRAIGVIYRPESERTSHYFYTCLPYQFDTIIHLDNTTAVQPLDVTLATA